jgi:hypothetical protein
LGLGRHAGTLVDAILGVVGDICGVRGHVMSPNGKPRRGGGDALA